MHGLFLARRTFAAKHPACNCMLLAVKQYVKMPKWHCYSEAADDLSFERYHSAIYCCHRQESGDLSAQTLLTQVIIEAIVKEGSVYLSVKPTYTSIPCLTDPCQVVTLPEIWRLACSQLWKLMMTRALLLDDCSLEFQETCFSSVRVKFKVLIPRNAAVQWTRLPRPQLLGHRCSPL